MNSSNIDIIVDIAKAFLAFALLAFLFMEPLSKIIIGLN